MRSLCESVMLGGLAAIQQEHTSGSLWRTAEHREAMSEAKLREGVK